MINQLVFIFWIWIFAKNKKNLVIWLISELMNLEQKMTPRLSAENMSPFSHSAVISGVGDFDKVFFSNLWRCSREKWRSTRNLMNYAFWNCENAMWHNRWIEFHAKEKNVNLSSHNLSSSIIRKWHDCRFSLGSTCEVHPSGDKDCNTLNLMCLWLIKASVQLCIPSCKPITNVVSTRL